MPPGENASAEPKAGIIEPDRLREIAQTDQLWAGLPAMSAETKDLASGRFDGSQGQEKLAFVRAQGSAAEIQFCENNGSAA